jgi:phenylacetate-CoA ligase
MKVSPKNFAAENIFIPLLYRHWNVPVFKHYRNLIENEKWSLGRLIELQRNKLIEIMRHVYLFVPYYRKVLTEMGASLEDMKNPEMIYSFPILTKEIIQERFNELVDPSFKKGDYTVEHTSGSSGQLTKVRRDLNARAAVHAATWRSNNWLGWELGDPWVWLWGRLNTTKTSWKSGYLNWYKARLTGEVFFNIHGLDKEKVHKFVNMMQSTVPTIIVGYTNALFQLCNLIKEENIAFPSPRGVATTAETLFPYQRGLIEEVMGCKVYDRYSSSEVGPIATECSAHDGLHLIMENIYMECVQEDKRQSPDGHPGKVLITDLNNRAMPLLRYDLDDLAIIKPPSQCNCGRSHQRLEKIVGRSTNVIMLPGGRFLFPEDLGEIFYPLDSVRKFQVIHEQPTKIKVLLVPKKKSDLVHHVDLVLKQLKEACGRGIELELSLVDDIPMESSGKHQICISKIQSLK